MALALECGGDPAIGSTPQSLGGGPGGVNGRPIAYLDPWAAPRVEGVRLRSGSGLFLVAPARLCLGGRLGKLPGDQSRYKDEQVANAARSRERAAGRGGEGKGPA